MDKYGVNTNFNTVTSPDEIIFAKSSKKVQLPLCDKTITQELSEDYSLPDYLPDIRRLLGVNVRFPEASKYIGGDIAEISGNACFNVIYTSGGGNLNCAEISVPYEVSAELDIGERTFPDSEFILFDEIKADTVNTKVTSPRKLSLRSRLAHRIRAYGDTDVDSRIFGDVEERSIQKLEHALPVCRVTCGTDDSITLEDSFALPEGAHAVAVNASCCIDTVSERDGNVECNGYVNLKLAVCTPDSSPSFTERKLPFVSSPVLSLDGDGYSFRAYGKISDISVEATDGNAICKISLCVCCDAQKNVPTIICSDIYSTKNDCEAELTFYKLPLSLCCGNFTAIHESSAAIDGLFEGAEVSDVSCCAECTSVTFENGHYILNGFCKYNVIFTGDSEYASRVSEFPFSAHICDGNDEINAYFADLSVKSCRLKKEGENFVFSADITAALRICGATDITSVSEADFLSPHKTSRSAFKIAYPAPDETLWDISKRYFADPVRIAKANGIKASAPDAADSLNGIKYIII